jgi:hypothetical protein
MSLISIDELKTLVERREGVCVSIFMPTHRTSPETKQDPIRFKNLLKEAEKRLITSGLRLSQAKKLLKPAKTLVKDNFFWQHQADGLAVFISPEVLRYFHLPFRFEELLVVTDRFHIKPLLHLFSNDGRFDILALSQNEVRLFQCTRYGITEIEPEGVPRSLKEALKYDEPEKQLQYHTRTPGGTGERAAIFHGHGVGIDDAKDNILRYFRQIDHGLRELLLEERSPVVLAGVEYLLPIYREANTFLNLMDKGVTGNPEGLRAEELHEQALKIVEPYFLKALEDASAQYRQLAGSGRTATDVKEIVPAAYNGRVDILFVSVGIQQWGKVDAMTFRVLLHEKPESGDQDLSDLAAVYTFLKGGKVYAVEPQKVPDEAPLAALLRY